MADLDAPTLPDGLVVVVKSECETCRTVEPVLGQLAAAGTTTIYTQDDPNFPASPSTAASWS